MGWDSKLKSRRIRMAKVDNNVEYRHSRKNIRILMAKVDNNGEYRHS